MLLTLLVVWVVVIPAITVVAGLVFTELRNRNSPRIARIPASRPYAARARRAAPGDGRLVSF